MGMSQSKLVKYENTVYYQIKKMYYGQKCMQDIEKINQASWFSRRGNIESHKTESGFNNQVVVANVLNMYVKNVNKQ